MHGVDWDAMTATYRKFLPHINNNYDYAEMLSELLGELNVSHTGGRFYPDLKQSRLPSWAYCTTGIIRATACVLPRW